MKTMRFAAIVVAGMAMAGATQAAAIKGTGTIGLYAPLGTVVALDGETFTDLFSATSLRATELYFLGDTEDFHQTPLVFDVIPSVTFDKASLGSLVLTLTDGSFNAQTSMTVSGTTYHSGVTGVAGSAASGSETVTLYLIGDFTPSGGLAAYDSSPMSVTLSLTETASGSITASNLGSFSISGTFAAPPSPPSPPVPEPASLAMLGSALVGLGLIRRKRT